MMCLVEGCANRANGRGGRCRKHYDLHRGAVLCRLEDCNRAASSHGLCSAHAARQRRTGTTEYVGSTGSAHWKWRGDGVTYIGAHFRVQAARGKATEHVCFCGSQAEQWAYDHQDANERQSDRGPYSPDPNHYSAMCFACHRRFDARRLELIPA